MAINSEKKENNMKDLTQEDINKAVVDAVTPLAEKTATFMGKAKPMPNILQRAFTKIFTFIWGLICMPFIPVISIWRKS
tara:strand:+ start:60 stop:296 length:237 start_codon:yes stop_codon:yes gene_type:complete